MGFNERGAAYSQQDHLRKRSRSTAGRSSCEPRLPLPFTATVRPLTFISAASATRLPIAPKRLNCYQVTSLLIGLAARHTPS